MRVPDFIIYGLLGGVFLNHFLYLSGLFLDLVGGQLKWPISYHQFKDTSGHLEAYR